jgi:hypothetical protein
VLLQTFSGQILRNSGTVPICEDRICRTVFNDVDPFSSFKQAGRQNSLFSGAGRARPRSLHSQPLNPEMAGATTQLLVKVRHGRAHHDHRNPNFGHVRRAGDWCSCLVALQLTDARIRFCPLCARALYLRRYVVAWSVPALGWASSSLVGRHPPSTRHPGGAGIFARVHSISHYNGRFDLTHDNRSLTRLGVRNDHACGLFFAEASSRVTRPS